MVTDVLVFFQLQLLTIRSSKGNGTKRSSCLLSKVQYLKHQYTDVSRLNTAFPINKNLQPEGHMKIRVPMTIASLQNGDSNFTKT
jgi:hypothetical protein